MSERGFSLAEMLVSVAITLAVAGGVFAVVGPAHGTFRTQLEIADMQQRLRVGADALARDLLMAGAGSDVGSALGPLACIFAAVLPYRQGGNASLDQTAGAAGFFDPTSITVFYVPPAAAQTTLARAWSDVSTGLVVNAGPGCPAGPSCGFQNGMAIAVYDESGAFDAMTIADMQNDSAVVQHNQRGPLSKSYDAGAKVVQIVQRAYYWSASTNQLMQYDGSSSGVGVPVVDNVVGIAFEYWGDPEPPALAHPGLDQRTTYGPRPPAPGLPSHTAYGDGANCIIELAGDRQVRRLPALGPAASGLVKLNDPERPETSLTDGPWCPDANDPHAFDADLLRVRKVVVTVRVQAADAALRGRSPALFRNPGLSGGANQFAPDQQIVFEIAPRNLGLVR